ncbi:hypothetical protein HY251_06635, partial [bacterium]|nr:hypothetical protein [bacterium]
VVELADDNTFAGSRDPGPLLEALARSGARWFTEADWRIGERPDVLRDLASAGCVQMLVGFESRGAGMGPKAAPPERVLDAARAIQEAGVAVIGCFIAGEDGETRASLERLGTALREAPLADVQVTLATPFPGTPLRRRLEREGRLLADRGWSHYTLLDATFRPDRLTVEELEAGFRSVLRAAFLLPLAASLVPSFLLAGLAWFGMLRRAEHAPRFRHFYPELLGVFWMTAPLAWFYAIPWERIVRSPIDAAACNLWTLGLVALWRVLLAMRFVRVLSGARGAGPHVFVILVSTALLGSALAFLPPNVNILARMSGIRLSPKEEVLVFPSFIVILWTLFTGWFWLVSAVTVLIRREPRWQPPSAPTTPPRIGRGHWILAGSALAFFVALLPVTQPEQMRRRAVEALADKGQIEDAVGELARHGAGDYPPFWEAPAHEGIALVRAAEAATQLGVPEWLRRTYVERLQAEAHSFVSPDPFGRGAPLVGADLERFVALLERLPEGSKIAERACHGPDLAGGAQREAADAARLDRLRALAGSTARDR